MILYPSMPTSTDACPAMSDSIRSSSSPGPWTGELAPPFVYTDPAVDGDPYVISCPFPSADGPGKPLLAGNEGEGWPAVAEGEDAYREDGLCDSADVESFRRPFGGSSWL